MAGGPEDFAEAGGAGEESRGGVIDDAPDDPIVDEDIIRRISNASVTNEAMFFYDMFGTIQLLCLFLFNIDFR